MRKKQLSSSVFDVIVDYPWPCNIRELENVIEHCFYLCNGEVIQTEHLPKRIRGRNKLENENNIAAPVKNIHEAERQIIISVLTKYNGNRLLATQELQMHVTTLWRKLKKYRITVSS